MLSTSSKRRLIQNGAHLAGSLLVKENSIRSHLHCSENEFTLSSVCWSTKASAVWPKPILLFYTLCVERCFHSERYQLWSAVCGELIVPPTKKATSTPVQHYGLHYHITFEILPANFTSLEIHFNVYYFVRHFICKCKRIRDGSVTRGRYTNVVT